MHYSPSILALVLGLGIYSAGPIITKHGPFAATAAHAEGDSEGGGGDSSGDGADSPDTTDTADTPDTADTTDTADTPDTVATTGSNSLCVTECNDN